MTVQYQHQEKVTEERIKFFNKKMQMQNAKFSEKLQFFRFNPTPIK